MKRLSTDNPCIRINEEGRFEYVELLLTQREFNVFKSLRSAKPTHSVLHDVDLSEGAYLLTVRDLKKKFGTDRNGLVRMAILYFRNESDDVPRMVAGTPRLKG